MWVVREARPDDDDLARGLDLFRGLQLDGELLRQMSDTDQVLWARAVSAGEAQELGGVSGDRVDLDILRRAGLGARRQRVTGTVSRVRRRKLILADASRVDRRDTDEVRRARREVTSVEVGAHGDLRLCRH